MKLFSVLGRMYERRRLTRLEIGIYAVGCAFLLAIFANALLDYMELAENTAVHITLQSVTSAIDMRLAADLIRGRPIARGSWSGRNPFEIAGGSSPPSFSGELGDRSLAALERPAWTFDARSGELIYLPRLRRGLSTNDPDGVLRFRLLPRPGGPGYMLVSTSHYEWRPLQ